MRRVYQRLARSSGQLPLRVGESLQLPWVEHSLCLVLPKALYTQDLFIFMPSDQGGHQHGSLQSTDEETEAEGG